MRKSMHLDTVDHADQVTILARYFSCIGYETQRHEFMARHKIGARGFQMSLTAQVWKTTSDVSYLCTLDQKLTFNPEITKNLMFEKCEFCEK